jgi:hypothetical protein
VNSYGKLIPNYASNLTSCIIPWRWRCHGSGGYAQQEVLIYCISIMGHDCVLISYSLDWPLRLICNASPLQAIFGPQPNVQVLRATCLQRLKILLQIASSRLCITQWPGTAVFLKLSATTDHFIHRQSAHTQTTFVKFPTPKSACKRKGETLYQWSNLTKPQFKVFYKIMTVGQEVMERTNLPTFC